MTKNCNVNAGIKLAVRWQTFMKDVLHELETTGGFKMPLIMKLQGLGNVMNNEDEDLEAKENVTCCYV